MSLFTILFALIFNSPVAHAFPVGEVRSLDAPFYLQEFAEGEYDFNGIVGLSNCSGSLVRFKNQPDSSQAYVLTNGHCTGGLFGGFIQPGEYRDHEVSSRSMNAYINVNDTVRVRTHTLVYATMTGTDMALYRLNETYVQLEAKGVTALEMTDSHPQIGDEIEIISGYWRKGFSCSIEDFIFELHEGGWVMNDSVRYSPTGCEVYGGTSGSPVVLKGERVVVAINNTGNESGQMCTTNNPCEVDEDGNKKVIKGRGYAQQIYQVYSCLTDDFDINLKLAGCELFH